MNRVIQWAEDHPTEALLIGGGGVLVFLYLFGFFGSSGSNASNAGASNLASAYYAAEAQQAVVGGQIQMATINDQAAVAQTQDIYNAQVAMNSANNATYTAISNNQTSANAGNNAANVAMNASNNATAATLGEQQLQTTLGQTMLGNIVPSELALTGGTAAFDMPGGMGTYFIDPTGDVSSPANLMAVGYTPAQAAQLLGVTA